MKKDCYYHNNIHTYNAVRVKHVFINLNYFIIKYTNFLMIAFFFLLMAGCNKDFKLSKSSSISNYYVKDLLVFKVDKTMKHSEPMKPVYAYYHVVFDFDGVGSVDCFPPAENYLA